VVVGRLVGRRGGDVGHMPDSGEFERPESLAIQEIKVQKELSNGESALVF